MMKALTVLPIVCLYFLIPGVAAQTTLNNESIVKMANAGVGDDVIIGAVNTQHGEYRLNPDDIIQLKTNKVSDQVIAAMLKRAGAGAATQTPQTAAVAEIGVYYKSQGEWKDLKPEVVNWKTGGVVKHVGSLGIIKGDLNGLIHAGSSPNKVKLPIELLIYTAEGVGATEYQLVRLHEHNNSREFRTVTGGVFHVSEGAMRDLLTFDTTKTAPRTYTVTLRDLTAGEYGFLPPNATVEFPNRAAASLGKMYTFCVIE